MDVAAYGFCGRDGGVGPGKRRALVVDILFRKTLETKTNNINSDDGRWFCPNISALF